MAKQRIQFTGKDLDSWLRLPMVQGAHKYDDGRLVLSLGTKWDSVQSFQYLFEGDELEINDGTYKIIRHYGKAATNRQTAEDKAR